MNSKLNIKLNPHITGLKESATLAINLKAKAAMAKGEDVCHFGFGQSPFSVHPLIQMALAKNTHQKDYLPTRGLPDLCRAISSYYKDVYNYDLDENLIIVGPGSKEMLFQILYVLEGTVIVPAPSWVSYGPQVYIRGKEIAVINTKRENSYKLKAEELEEFCKKGGSDPKILILNNPSNPTGAVYKENEVKELSDVCRHHGVIVISDEIYSQINFSGHRYVGFHEYYPEGTIITSGLSKAHAAGGYRIGFIALPKGMEDVVKCLCAMVSETFSAVSAPIQYAALEAYSSNVELQKYIEDCTRIHKAAGEYLWRRFEGMGLNCPRPEGAFYLFPDFANFKDEMARKGISTCSQLCDHLFDTYKVALLPGSDFYYPEDILACRVASVDYSGDEVYTSSQAFEHLDDNFIEENCPHLKHGCDRISDFLQGI